LSPASSWAEWVQSCVSAIPDIEPLRFFSGDFGNALLPMLTAAIIALWQWRGAVAALRVPVMPRGGGAGDAGRDRTDNSTEGAAPPPRHRLKASTRGGATSRNRLASRATRFRRDSEALESL
jgi:hypothetical protein